MLYVFCSIFDSSNKPITTMITIKNTSGSKAVNITKTATGTIQAMYVQIFNGMEQVLQAKSFTTVKNAEKWAAKVL